MTPRHCSQLLRSCTRALTQGKKERLLCKHRESNNLVDQINMDLTYSVCFNLANAVSEVIPIPFVTRDHHSSGVFESTLCRLFFLFSCSSHHLPSPLQYHLNSMYQEALNTYSLIVKNKQYPQSGRLRVNMGNIYFEQASDLEVEREMARAL